MVNGLLSGEQREIDIVAKRGKQQPRVLQDEIHQEAAWAPITIVERVNADHALIGDPGGFNRGCCRLDPRRNPPHEVEHLALHSIGVHVFESSMLGVVHSRHCGGDPGLQKKFTIAPSLCEKPN